MRRRALILGVGGQDGSYLAELLVRRGYDVHGTVRRSSVDNLVRLPPEIREQVHIRQADLLDPMSIERVISTVVPHELYNMADQDNAGWSGQAPHYQLGATVGGVVAMLETVAALRTTSALTVIPVPIKVFQPVSALMFGRALGGQSPDTPLDPQSHYACAKAHVFHLCRMYRTMGVHVSCGIMYNHDSPRRGPHYLLQRIVRGVRIGGDLSSLVDIGWAPEYVEAAWQLLQLERPTDLCIGTGRPWRISDLLKVAEGAIVPRDRGDGTDEVVLTPDVRWTRNSIGWEAAYDARDVLLMLQGAKVRKELCV